MNESSGAERPQRRLTPEMLAATSCSRRFYLSYVANFRRRGRRTGMYPPKLKDAVRLALAERDSCVAAGLGPDESLERQRQVLFDWCDQVHFDAPAMMSKDDKAVLLLGIEEIRSEASRIVDNYNDCFAYAHESVHVTTGRNKEPIVGRLVEFKLPTVKKNRTMGRGGKWSYACRLDRVYITRQGYTALFVRAFTSRPAQQKGSMLPFMPWWAGHLWAAEKLIKRKIDQVTFDIVRLKGPGEPQLVKCKKCDGRPDCTDCRGTGFTRLSKRPCDTTQPVLDRVLQKYPHITTSGIEWAQHLAGRKSGFAYRERLTIGDGHDYVGQWVRGTYDTIRQLELVGASGGWPQNPYECDKCQFMGPCTARWKYENDAPFIRVHDEYPGL